MKIPSTLNPRNESGYMINWNTYWVKKLMVINLKNNTKINYGEKKTILRNIISLNSLPTRRVQTLEERVISVQV